MKYKLTILTAILALLLVGGNLSAQEGNLSKLISDMSAQDLKVRETAQQEWQKECMKAGTPGNDAARVDVCRQMVEQLDKDLPTVTKVWLLRQMAWVGKAEVVPAVAALLNDSTLEVRDAAARALAAITEPEALDALKSAFDKETDAVNKKRLGDAIASKNVSLKVGVETLAPQSLAYISDEELQKWIANAQKANLSVDEKCQALAALTVRGDKKYHNFAKPALSSQDDAVKKQGLYAMAKLGTTSDLPELIELLFNYDQELVANVLSQITADGFDDALLKRLDEEKDTQKYLVLARILSNRSVQKIVPAVLKKAVAEKGKNGVQYLRIAEPWATKADVSEMVDVLLLLTDGRERDDAERMITRVCKGDSEPVVKKVTFESGRELMPLLGRIGDEQALKALRRGMKNTVPSVRDAAYRGLCNWPNAVVAGDLLSAAENKELPENIRVGALRAFVRVISLPEGQIVAEISDAEKLEMLKKAMGMTTRTQEKQLIIDRASAVRLVETLQFVMQYIETPELTQNVCRSVEELARHDFLRRAHKEEFAPALEKVLEVSDDNGVKDKIRRYKQNM